MDTDRPSSEEASSDQPTPTMEEQGPSQVRSYECIFCKRGFSNAQALGGHMNIHRKDKAKLKKPSADQTTSSKQHHHQFGEINISPRDVMSPYSSVPTTTTPRSKPPESYPSDEGKLSNITWPNWMLQKDQIGGGGSGGGATRIESQSHGGVEVKQLPLFSEIPRVIAPNDQIQEQSTSSYSDRQQDVHHERLISHGESGSDIDLELRLGPEPQDSSPTNKGTKRFF